MTHPEPSPRDLLTMSYRAVRATAGRWFERGWGDDLVQETALKLLRCVQAGHTPQWRTAKRFAREALRVVFGDARYRSPWYDNELWDTVEVTVEAPLLEQGLLKWRLAEVWPTLTRQQQAGLLSVVDDGYGSRSEYAALVGTTPGALDCARKRALERVDAPAAFARVARRGVRDLSPENRRAYRRETSRRYRERQAQRRLVERGGGA